MFISPHKFLGGPNSSGILILHSKILCNSIPVNPGGGTVFWVDSKEHMYHSINTEREEGGTNNMESIIRVGMCHLLKHQLKN